MMKQPYHVECVLADILLDSCVLGRGVNVIAPRCGANESEVGFPAPGSLNTNTSHSTAIHTPLDYTPQRKHSVPLTAVISFFFF